jgi:hypothetical protein
MDHFDDIQIEELENFDFAEASFDDLFEQNDDGKSFNAFLNSNWDF